MFKVNFLFIQKSSNTQYQVCYNSCVSICSRRMQRNIYYSKYKIKLRKETIIRNEKVITIARPNKFIISLQ